MTETELTERLRTRFKAPEWAFFNQVPNATGGLKTRTADGVAMGLWPSRGLEIVGFEIKVHRSDWLKELRTPEKVEDGVFQYCDRWYIVAPRSVVLAGELPPTWGLLEPYGKGLRQKVQAPKLEPIGPDKLFLAAILRRAHRTPSLWRDEKLREARSLGYKEGQKAAESDVKTAEQQFETLKGKVQQFEEASGIRIFGGYKLGSIGEAVALIAANDFDGKHPLTNNLKRTIVEIERLHERAQEVRTGLSQLEETQR